MNQGRKNVFMALTVLTLGVLAACGSKTTDGSSVNRLGASGGSADLLLSVGQAPAFDIELYDGTTLVYKQSTGVGVLQMQNGKVYRLVVNSSSAPLLSMQLMQNQLLVGSPVSLFVGSNEISVPNVGSYTMKITAVSSSGALASRDFSLSVFCDNIVMSVDASKIAVASLGRNMYRYSAVGIETKNGAIQSGTNEPDCSWDFNGDGIRDRDYVPCATAVNAYSNHVGPRNIGIYVRDKSCLLVKKATASPAITLTDPNPAPTGPDSFIRGDVASVPASSDLRLNLKHVSMNPAVGPGAPAPVPSPMPVQCSYSRKDGKGTFTVRGQVKYEMGTSQMHGMGITFNEIVDNIDINAIGSTGSLGTSAAQIDKVTFMTDENPDSASRLRFEGGSSFCTGQITALYEVIAGTPCTGGQTGTGNKIDVRGYGQFQCLNLPSNPAGSTQVNITNGKFFCEPLFVDSCIGGSGGSGGGIPPIVL